MEVAHALHIAMRKVFLKVGKRSFLMVSCNHFCISTDIIRKPVHQIQVTARGRLICRAAGTSVSGVPASVPYAEYQAYLIRMGLTSGTVVLLCSSRAPAFTQQGGAKALADVQSDYLTCSLRFSWKHICVELLSILEHNKTSSPKRDVVVCQISVPVVKLLTTINFIIQHLQRQIFQTIFESVITFLKFNFLIFYCVRVFSWLTVIRRVCVHLLYLPPSPPVQYQPRCHQWCLAPHYTALPVHIRKRSKSSKQGNHGAWTDQNISVQFNSIPLNFIFL